MTSWLRHTARHKDVTAARLFAVQNDRGRMIAWVRSMKPSQLSQNIAPMFVLLKFFISILAIFFTLPQVFHQNVIFRMQHFLIF